MQIPRSRQDHGPWHFNLDKLRVVRMKSQPGALPHCLGSRHLLCDASQSLGHPCCLLSVSVATCLLSRCMFVVASAGEPDSPTTQSNGAFPGPSQTCFP